MQLKSAASPLHVATAEFTVSHFKIRTHRHAPGFKLIIECPDMKQDKRLPSTKVTVATPPTANWQKIKTVNHTQGVVCVYKLESTSLYS